MSFLQNKKRVKLLLLLATKFLVLYYSSPGKLMQTVIEAGAALGDSLRLQRESKMLGDHHRGLAFLSGIFLTRSGGVYLFLLENNFPEGWKWVLLVFLSPDFY